MWGSATAIEGATHTIEYFASQRLWTKTYDGPYHAECVSY